MAIYHCSVKTISRNQGRSAVASIAYRACEKIKNEYDGIVHDYTHKKDIVYKEIMLPEQAPKNFYNRSVLWNEVEKSEKRINSRTAREIEVALPKELNRTEQIKLIREYTKENFIDKGMCADICIHDKKDGNIHAHIMLTTREVSEKGFTKKNRDWDKVESLEEWRKNWAEITNKYLKMNKISERIDHRNYKEQGIEKIPTIHLGVSAHQMEKKGIKTERGNINREIKKENEILKQNVIEINQLKKLRSSELEKNKNVESEKPENLLYGLKEVYAKLELDKIELINKINSFNDKELVLRSNLDKIIEHNNIMASLEGTEGKYKNKLDTMAGVRKIFKFKEIQKLKENIRDVQEKRLNIENEFNKSGLNKVSVQSVKNNIQKLESNKELINEEIEKINNQQRNNELAYKLTITIFKMNNKFIKTNSLLNDKVKSIETSLLFADIENRFNQITKDDYKIIYNRLPEQEKEKFNKTVGKSLEKKEKNRKQTKGLGL